MTQPEQKQVSPSVAAEMAIYASRREGTWDEISKGIDVPRWIQDKRHPKERR